MTFLKQSVVARNVFFLFSLVCGTFSSFEFGDLVVAILHCYTYLSHLSVCPPPPQSPSRSPLASDCSSRRSSVSSTSSREPEVKPEVERVRHREVGAMTSLVFPERPFPRGLTVCHRQVEKLLRAVADGDVEMVRTKCLRLCPACGLINECRLPVCVL